MIDEPNAITNVPQIKGRMPNLGGVSSGLRVLPVRKSITLTPDFRKKPKVSIPRTTTIPTVVKIVIAAQSMRNAVTPDSRSERSRVGRAQCAAGLEGVGLVDGKGCARLGVASRGTQLEASA